ncbi:MAG: DUF1326 domain-containing protein [Myxococcales bacterium]|nr:DUF1326 domain-containing protein [Myxococcales bacterium]MDH5305819.1 DUF1326 domain-containing protein [Myxococcales bacterium]MDH5565796.1 DUF1326 domain-containing protein [Myxococcales bacterium]
MKPWKIRGELVLSCNCDVFCPCVVSLGRSQPTQGVCYTWWGLHIEEGRAGDVPLSGLNAAVLMDVPGPLAEGKWTVGLYIDERAGDSARDALVEILSGKAGGPTGWFSIMIAEFLGVKQVPIEFERKDRGWRVSIPKIIDGTVEPIEGADGESATRVTNTKYWMSSDVTVCRGTRSRFRDWGRNWDLSGRSGEYARIEWAGP